MSDVNEVVRTESIKKYVAGFLLSGEDVLLVQKMKPEWQRGLWNGVGGKVDYGETPLQAMAREFSEETGIPTDIGEWRCFAEERGRGYHTCFYSARRIVRPVVPRVNDVGEPLGWQERHMSGIEVVGNLHWLVPMAHDWRGVRASITASQDIVERPSW